jgi:hypothetical protein
VDGKDMTGELKSCTKDDEFVFHADKSYQYLTGMEKCNSSDADMQGAWKLSDDQKKIVYINGSETSEEEIAELSATTLKTRYMYDNMEYIFTYTAQ